MFDILVNIINFLIDVIATGIEGVISLLPESPFEFNNFDWGPFGQLILLFIPVGDIITHFTLLLTSIGTWYAIRAIFRILQVIR